MTGDATTTPNRLRLDVFLSRSGLCSRRAAKELIRSEKVRVNGEKQMIPGYRISLENDTVTYKGKILSLPKEHVYFLFHKPIKVESTNKKTSTRTIAREFLMPFYKQHLFSIGRLDFMSSGLMIYTTDGDTAYMLSHPRFRVKKKYVVTSFRTIPVEILRAWQKGYLIGNMRYTLAAYTLISRTCVLLTLQEGKNREIRTVFSHHKIPIASILRISIGPFSLNTLKPGEVRRIRYPRKELDILHSQLHP